MKRLFFISAAVLFIFSCGEKKDPNAKADGKLIFEKNCSICHGNDGKLGLGNAKDLSVSTMDMDSRIQIISYGKPGMTPFKGVLEDNEIEAVAQYIEQLRKP